VVTLGFPAPVENWSNDHVLKFIRLMWRDSPMEVTNSAEESSVASSQSGGQPNQFENRDVADPKTVIKVANLAFEKLGDATGQVLAKPDTDYAGKLNDSLVVPRNAVILEISKSGVLQVPRDIEFLLTKREATRDISKVKTAPQISLEAHSSCTSMSKRRLATLLQVHRIQLEALSRKTFNKSELWKLHRIYFSPIDGENSVELKKDLNRSPDDESAHASDHVTPPSFVVSDVKPIVQSYRHNGPGRTSSMPTSICRMAQSRLQRRASYTSLHDALTTTPSVSTRCEEQTQELQGTRRRYSYGKVETDEGDERLPSTKRARSSKTRVDLYPRIKVGFVL